MSDLVGQQWGSYHLTRLLGRGGFAEVYLGEHARLKMKAAIKILHTYLSEKDAGQFRQEAQIISRLMHPHIVRLLDFDLNNGRPFLVLDYAPQGSLRQRPGERLPLPQVVTYVRQAASALQYAHDQRLIHRDVKPANMLLGRQQEVLLSDFGIAAVIHSTSSMSQQNAVGTLVYMAPEQIQGYPRLASDQYALAVTVYQWLCGVLPFQGALSDIITGHLTRTPQRLRDLDDAIPVAVEEIVLTALAKDPLQRFASVSAFAIALEQAALSSTPTFLQAPSTQIEQQQVVQQRASGPMIEVDTSQQAQEQQRRSRRSLLINGTVAVGMIALGGGILLSRRFSLPTGSSAPSGPVIYTYTGHVSQNKNAPNGIFSLSWSPDSKSIASIGYSSQSRNDFTVQVWGARGDGHPALYQVKEPVARGTDSYVLDLCWTQDGPQVVSATESGLITVANAANGNETLTYREHINNGEQVQSVAWSPDGRFIASVGQNNWTLVGQNNWTNDSLAANGTPIRIWNATNGQTIATCILKRQPDLAEERLAQMKVLWSPDSQHIVTWGLSGNFSVWNAQRGALVARYTQAWKDFRTQIVKNDKLIIVYHVGWSPDGKYLFWQGTIGDNSLKTTRVWSRDTGKQLGTLKIPDLEISPFGLWSPDSQILAVPHNKKVTLWRVQDGSAVYTYEPGTYIEEFSWSPDGRHIATYEERELYGFQLALWEATTGKGRTIYTQQRGDSGPPDLGYLHWSPDGKLIAVASSGPIDIWQVH